jgi:F0F1-type ATP synthase membrane subunit a
MLMAIEILSYTARAISLGVRLAANITSGHILLAIISSFAIVPGLPLSVAVLLATFVLVLL